MHEAAHSRWQLNLLVAKDAEYQKQRNALVVTQVLQTQACGILWLQSGLDVWSLDFDCGFRSCGLCGMGVSQSRL